MAISDDLPGVEVKIIVDGKALQEYEDTNTREDERTVTRYIEAVSGKAFSVDIEAAKETKFRGDCLACYVWVDGENISTPLLEKKICAKMGDGRLVQGSDAPGGLTRTTLFSEIETVADGNMLKSEAAKVKELGSIKVTVRHERERGPAIGETQDKRSGHIGILSEKATKGGTLSHSVSFGAAAKLTDTDYVSSKAVKGAPNPAAVYVFHYRSLQCLKVMRIIPRTPSPPPLEERDFASLNQDELRELQKRFKAMQEREAAAVKIKREKTDDNPRPRKIARPHAGDTQLEIGEDGDFRESSTATLEATPQEVIELD